MKTKSEFSLFVAAETLVFVKSAENFWERIDFYSRF